MRKQYKKKKRSCPMCKPYKMGWDNRWKLKDKIKMDDSQKEIEDSVRRDSNE